MPGPAPRRTELKKGIDNDEARRRREETSVQLRKDKREEQLQKRRQIKPSTQDGGQQDDGRLEFIQHGTLQHTSKLDLRPANRCIPEDSSNCAYLQM